MSNGAVMVAVTRSMTLVPRSYFSRAGRAARAVNEQGFRSNLLTAWCASSCLARSWALTASEVWWTHWQLVGSSASSSQATPSHLVWFWSRQSGDSAGGRGSAMSGLLQCCFVLREGEYCGLYDDELNWVVQEVLHGSPSQLSGLGSLLTGRFPDCFWVLVAVAITMLRVGTGRVLAVCTGY